MQRSTHRRGPAGSEHGGAAGSGEAGGGSADATAPASPTSRLTPAMPSARASQGRAGIALAAPYSITSSSTGRLALGSSTRGSRPPRRIELPSYSVRWSIGAGSSQSLSRIWPLWP
jgi:hypothetical protein